MADTVRIVLERLVPALNELVELELFTASEVKAIVHRRETFEYRLKRRVAAKIDYLRYLTYELNLEALRRVRKHRLGLRETTPSEFAGIKHIHTIFDRAVRRFRSDVSLWLQYIDFAMRAPGGERVLSRVFPRALQVHPRCEQLWLQASAWEYDHQGNIGSARVMMQRALRINKGSKRLWLDYFRLECIYVLRMRARRMVLGLDLEGATDEQQRAAAAVADKIDSAEDAATDAVPVAAKQRLLRGEIPIVVFRTALRQCSSDVAFAGEFLRILDSFPPEDAMAASEDSDGEAAADEEDTTDMPENAFPHVTEQVVSTIAREYSGKAAGAALLAQRPVELTVKTLCGYQRSKLPLRPFINRAAVNANAVEPGDAQEGGDDEEEEDGEQLAWFTSDKLGEMAGSVPDALAAAEANETSTPAEANAVVQNDPVSNATAAAPGAAVDSKKRKRDERIKAAKTATADGQNQDMAAFSLQLPVESLLEYWRTVRGVDAGEWEDESEEDAAIRDEVERLEDEAMEALAGGLATTPSPQMATAMMRFIERQLMVKLPVSEAQAGRLTKLTTQLFELAANAIVWENGKLYSIELHTAYLTALVRQNQLVRAMQVATFAVFGAATVGGSPCGPLCTNTSAYLLFLGVRDALKQHMNTRATQTEMKAYAAVAGDLALEQTVFDAAVAMPSTKLLQAGLDKLQAHLAIVQQAADRADAARTAGLSDGVALNLGVNDIRVPLYRKLLQIYVERVGQAHKEGNAKFVARFQKRIQSTLAAASDAGVRGIDAIRVDVVNALNKIGRLPMLLSNVESLCYGQPAAEFFDALLVDLMRGAEATSSKSHSQTTENTIRSVFEKAVKLHGSNEAELWLNFVRFERSTGPEGLQRADKVHWRAIKALEDPSAYQAMLVVENQ